MTLILLCLTMALKLGLISPICSGFATENKTLMQFGVAQNMSNTTNATNIVLVHGGWADGSGWNKQIPTFAPDRG